MEVRVEKTFIWMRSGRGKWLMQCLEDIRCVKERDESWVWKEDEKLEYTVRSLYKTLRN